MILQPDLRRSSLASHLHRFCVDGKFRRTFGDDAAKICANFRECFLGDSTNAIFPRGVGSALPRQKPDRATSFNT